MGACFGGSPPAGLAEASEGTERADTLDPQKGVAARVKDAAANPVRTIVSQAKRRFEDEENHFDLDLTYIVDKRIIAMGIPETGAATVYRNSMSEIQRFFKVYHRKKFKVYNLCSEDSCRYDPEPFLSMGGRYENSMSWTDHNAPPLKFVPRFVADVKSFPDEDEEHCVAIHCKGGKGRTGCIIACYFLFANMASSPKEALDLFAERRTTNMKGVNKPSQIRFVEDYFEHILPLADPMSFPFEQDALLSATALTNVPDFDVVGKCDPYFILFTPEGDKIWDQRDHQKIKAVKHSIKFDNLDILVRGTFRMQWYDHDFLSADDAMCWCWFNTGVGLIKQHITLTRKRVDGTVDAKLKDRWTDDFALDVWFKPA